jgi:CubicO group peptidase (beta-lactamase class C family)
MLAHQIPGVSLAVLRRGKIVLLKSYGFANVEHQVPVKPSTIFQSGSMGKQFHSRCRDDTGPGKQALARR